MLERFPRRFRRSCVIAWAIVSITGFTGCGGGDVAGVTISRSPSPPISTQPLPVRATLLDARLYSPWSMAFLPDGRMLITQKAGTLVIVRADGSAVDASVDGVPAVNDSGQGGLLDVALDPDFVSTGWVYLSYSEDGPGGSGTALARAQLVGNALRELVVIWRQQPKSSGSSHYGSRIVFRPDGTLYLTLGDRARDDPGTPNTAFAQNVESSLGKVVRLNRDGSIPADNPVFVQTGALPGLWSLGHRNPQGAALLPGTSELWLSEHGPQGGDELNRVGPGGNYGWPLRSYGCPYDATVSSTCGVGGGTHAPDYEEPNNYWGPPSTAPAGMAFYTGSQIAEWQGNVFVGALAGKTLWRLVLDANLDVAVREEVGAVAALNQRIRDVRQGPDGWLYLLSDEGRIVRLER